MDVDFEIKEDIGTLGKTRTTRKALTLTSWNGKPEKYDIRLWRTYPDGKPAPGKGITLTSEELEVLTDILICRREGK